MSKVQELILEFLLLSFGIGLFYDAVNESFDFNPVAKILLGILCFIFAGYLLRNNFRKRKGS
jgi:hypothetical protein